MNNYVLVNKTSGSLVLRDKYSERTCIKHQERFQMDADEVIDLYHEMSHGFSECIYEIVNLCTLRTCSIVKKETLVDND